MAKTYRIIEGEMHDRFMRSRAKVQFIGGGFGNGKTAAMCVKALRLAKDYPGSNGLVSRSTYPKLNDSIRKEFLMWTPTTWVERKPTRDDNTLKLKNGTTVNFRYVQQQGTKTEQSTSNLLSATYDWIVVDQMEDPEFQHKDFLDLLGRLRGNTDYTGDDPTMPRNGPRWIMISSNPTRNWVFRELVRPMHRYMDPNNPVIDPKLLIEVGIDEKPVLKDGKPVPIMDLFEASTLENAHNVGDDYIRTMLATYKGTMRDRFVHGKWGALSGLVYPAFDESVHVLERTQVADYLVELRRSGFKPTWVEGYDHGLIVESCYILAFVDDDNNLFIVDGFYNKEQSIEDSAKLIKEMRAKWMTEREVEHNAIYADPDLFRRKPVNGITVGITVADIFKEYEIELQRGDAGISAGIAKVGQYIALVPNHEHPIMGNAPSPHLFVSDSLDFLINEFSEYYWKSNTSGEQVDQPSDRNDHGMDALKYLLTDRPRIAAFKGRSDAPKSYMAWHEVTRNERKALPRHR